MNQRFYLLKRQLLGIEPAIRRRFVDKIPPLVTGQISKPERSRMKKVFADTTEACPVAGRVFLNDGNVPAGKNNAYPLPENL